MRKIGVIGYGAIGAHVAAALPGIGARLGCVIVPETACEATRAALGTDLPVVSRFADAPEGLDVIAECAGHPGLEEHGPEVLGAGCPMVTVSLGALADAALADRLDAAARAGGTRLHLATGAIGALDALAAARQGGLDRVMYTGRKPPAGWRGSLAEEVLDLDAVETPTTHFRGTAREAALAYPKNANVAAAVALAGPGFEATRVELIADPGIDANIHGIHAEGSFGSFSFRIAGRSLPGNPRSSALAALSVLARLDNLARPVGF